MLTYLYDWIENISFYLVIVVAVMQMVPGETYQKYIRFFAGMILILMLASPLLKILGMSELPKAEYQEQLRKMEEATGMLQDRIEEEEIEREGVE